MKILSVDDSRMIRRLIGSAISVMGFDVLEAGDGKQALAVLETEYPNVGLIMLDWNMPEMDGYECLVAIKADERFKHIPVMMCTTESERENVIKAIKAGAKSYVSKPFTPEDLVTKIMECLGQGLDL
ncbi:MAG: response regulator [Myxococcales bacterium]|nr:response regulator [Myxococcales bacterium]